MMHVTPEQLAAAYDYLRAMPPFKSWKLPPAEEVEFSVTRHRDRYGDHTTYTRTLDHCIRVSTYYVKTGSDLLLVMGHEMIHAHQTRKGSTSKHTSHNAEFKKLHRRMCCTHGFPVTDI